MMKNKKTLVPNEKGKAIPIIELLKKEDSITRKLT